MKNAYIFLFLFIFLITLSSALEMSANFENNVIVKEFNNEVLLHLSVSGAEKGYYNVYTYADVSMEPSNFFFVNDNDFDLDVKIKALNALDIEGNYVFTYTLNQRGVQKIDEKGMIKVLSLENVLKIETNSIDLEDGIVKVYVQNLEDVDFKDLKVEFFSILFDFDKVFDLKSKETAVFEVNVDKTLLRKTKAGVYIIDAVFDTPKGETKILGKIYLNEKKGITTQEDVGGLLIRTLTINKINSGNVVENVRVEVKKNIFTRLFTSFNEEPVSTVRSGWGITYYWTKNINPSEIFTIKVRTNYLFPLLIIVFVVLIILGVKRFLETKVEVKKTVSPIKTKNGEFALRVTLNVKAKTGMNNVTLVDRVPRPVKIYNKFGMNKPDEIDAVNRRLKWFAGDLNSGEERVYTYIVYSKVGYVGKFSLPPAVLLFEKEHKLHEVESNSVFFMSDQVRKEN